MNLLSIKFIPAIILIKIVDIKINKINVDEEVSLILNLSLNQMKKKKEREYNQGNFVI